MRRRILFIFVIFLATLTACQSGRSSSGSETKAPGKVRDISSLIEAEMKTQGLPAAAALIIEGDRVVARGAAGVRVLGKPEKVGFNDRWHLGSCTKTFTATLIGMLVERGKLSWDTTLAEALPDLSETMLPEYRNVTMEMLLAHRGGIDSEHAIPGLWATLWRREGSPMEQRLKMAKAMLVHPPKVKPGEFFYANCSYAIAGHIAETTMQEPWEQLVRRLIFKPLGMTSAGFGVTWESEPATDPFPHNMDETPVQPGPFADNPPSIGPGATIHASIEDWAKFIIDHLKGAREKNGRLLKAETYARIHKKRRIRKGHEGYALGWFTINQKWATGDVSGNNGNCLTHEGSNNSWYAIVWIAPERNFAVLSCTNIGGNGVQSKAYGVFWKVVQDHLKNAKN
ncbi:MAG: beta-lactamase family protein [bacterium]|nr:beta-lactamase family protein [bacterium]